MANTVIALKKSATPSAVPASLEYGELALNYADGKIFYKAANGSIYSISGNPPAGFATVNANGTFIVAGTSEALFSLVPGDFINITGDAINDKITISANVQSVFDRANAAAKVTMSNTAPTGNNAGDFWWNSDLGRLLIYYNDGDTSQWVEATAMLGPDYGLVYDVANAAYDQANSSISGGLGTVFEATNAAFGTANAAFDKANNAIANTSNVIIYGDLRVTGTLNVGNSTTTITTSNVNANNITVRNTLIVNNVDILTTVNSAFAAANAAGSGDVVIAAFDKANTANALAYKANVNAIAAFAQANTANTTAKYAFDKANAGSNVTFTQFVIKGGGNLTVIYANSNSSSFNIETGNGITYSNTANGLNLGLTTTGVTAGYYGANNVIPIVQIDQFGRVTSIVNVAAQASSVNGTIIINSTVNNQKLANVSQGTVKGRANTGTGEVQDLSFTEFVNALPTFTTTDKGVVPATGTIANNFLRDDATWQPVLQNTNSNITFAGNLTVNGVTTFSGNVSADPSANALIFHGTMFGFGTDNPINYEPDWSVLVVGGKDSRFLTGGPEGRFGDIIWQGKNDEYIADFYVGDVAGANTFFMYFNVKSQIISTANLEFSGSPVRFSDRVGILKDNPGTYALDVNGTINASDVLINGSSISGGAAFDAANAAFAQANTTDFLLEITSNNAINAGEQAWYARNTANASFNVANIAIANVNYVNTAMVAAYGQANVATTTAIAAFDKANISSGGGITLSAQNTAPTGVANNLWFNTDTGELYVYYADWDGTSQWTQINGGAGGSIGALKNADYYHMFFYPGYVDANVTMYLNISPTNYTLPANLLGSYARVVTAPTGNNANLRILKNNIYVGNISFARNNTNGTFVFANTTTFAPGDVIRILSPVSVDPAMADIAVSLLGIKT